ncbi:MAG: DUF362 domain-containing protein [Armatimonadota bacterium]|nr:DUF362 domain-containing protein [Armatimonadota bacterium]
MINKIIRDDRQENHVARPKVSIRKADRPISEKTIDLAVRRAAELAGVTGADFNGKSVVIKPNVFCPRPAPTTTDPRVVAALIRLAKDAGARSVTVAEGRSVSTARFRKGQTTTRACFEAVGMREAVEKAGAKIVYLEEDEPVHIELPGAEILKHATVPRTILEAEAFINAPVLKNHSLALITMGIKNLHGIISDADKLFGHNYRQLPQKLADLLRIRKPDLTVIDGITGQERDHAEEGAPVDMGIIIAGRDTVAVDAVASSIIGLDPLEVETTKAAQDSGLGVANLAQIDVVGETIESVLRPFARPDIELSESRFPGLRIISGDYCRSCEYYIRRGVDKLVENGLLDPNDKITLILGKEPEVPDKIDGRTIILGDCAIASESIKRLRNNLFLEGRLRVVFTCPPMAFRMTAPELVAGNG